MENNDQGDNDDEQEGGEEEGGKTDEAYIKRSVRNLNLDQCTIVKWIGFREELHKFEMTKVLSEEDPANDVKRMPRTKAELDIVRPW